jgi:hypothetical protein
MVPKVVLAGARLPCTPCKYPSPSTTQLMTAVVKEQIVARHIRRDFSALRLNKDQIK